MAEPFGSNSDNLGSNSNNVPPSTSISQTDLAPVVKIDPTKVLSL